MDNPRELFVALLNAGGFLLCVGFIGYVLLILIPYLRRVPTKAGDARGFQWHFIIPCLNEAPVIEKTVRNLVRTFPGCRVWCVDDGSTDGTGDVLAALAAEFHHIHVVTRTSPDARKGKGAALNAGWAALDRSVPPGPGRDVIIVGVLDADGELDPHCLDAVSGPAFFGNPKVGAVQTRVRVTVDDDDAEISRMGRLLVRLQDVEFNGVIAAMQTLRRHVGSVGMGGNGQFTRLSVLDRIAEARETPWHNALCEDLELGLHVLLEGFRTEYCHDTWVRQQGLPSFRLLVRQRSRWAQGAMQCTRYFGPILRSPRIKNSGALEIGYFLIFPWLQVVGGIFYVSCLAFLTYVAVNAPAGPWAWFGQTGWGLLVLLILFGLVPLAIWGPVYRKTAAPEISRLKASALGLACWPYTYVHQFAAWWAFGRFVRARHDWKKTERQPSRLPSTVDPVAIPSMARAPVPAMAALGSMAAVVGRQDPSGPRLIVRGTLSLDPPPRRNGSPAVVLAGRFSPSPPPGDELAAVAHRVPDAVEAYATV